MRCVVLGAGSIGLRHLRNARQLGHEIAAVCDPDPSRLAEAAREVPGDRCVADETEALSRPADAALICSPTAAHVEQARRAIARGLHCFIEKPLSHALDGAERLAAEARAAHRVTLVGCNLRFLPSLRLVRELIEAGRIGRVLAARAQCGYYLPFWRPGSDHRLGYGANRAQGGGVLLDCVHEFDYLRWLLGEVAEVRCVAGRVSELTIDTEDTADALLRMASGVVVNLHLDYLQRTYRRSCEIIGERGVIVWDYIAQTVLLYGERDRHAELMTESINVERNHMFVEELRHFAACVEGREAPMLEVDGARRVLEIVMAAKRSAESGEAVRVG